jgi:hypothetical protein
MKITELPNKWRNDYTAIIGQSVAEKCASDLESVIAENPCESPTLCRMLNRCTAHVMFYSYDPEKGIRFHDTAQEAEASAEEALADAIVHAEDSDFHWRENESEISWGQVGGHAEMNVSDDGTMCDPKMVSLHNV